MRLDAEGERFVVAIVLALPREVRKIAGHAFVGHARVRLGDDVEAVNRGVRLFPLSLLQLDIKGVAVITSASDNNPTRLLVGIAPGQHTRLLSDIEHVAPAEGLYDHLSRLGVGVEEAA